MLRRTSLMRPTSLMLYAVVLLGCVALGRGALLQATASAVVQASTPPAPPGQRPVPGAWSSLNPGAGGQIQAVVLDPNIVNRAYLLSDVEGLYITADGGESWVYSSAGLAGTDTLSLAAEPGNSKVLYLGTSVGLHTSGDGGAHWKLHPQLNRAGPLGQLTDDPADPGYGSGKMSVGAVAVDPQAKNQVVVGLGGRRWSAVKQATVYRSTDRGASFGRVTLGAAAGGNQSVLQLAARQTTAGTVLYAAAGDAGLWQSPAFGAAGSWTKIPKPGRAAGHALGISVSPDGSTLYAVYRDGARASDTVLYTSRAAQMNWIRLPFGGLKAETDNQFRSVALDPSVAGAGAQRLVIADSNDRRGLYEVNVTWKGAVPSAHWSKVFGYGQRAGAQNPADNARFEIGWEGGIFGARPRPLSFAYAPKSWHAAGRPELWTTGDQTVFKTNRAHPDFQDRWTPLYTSAPVQAFPETTVNVGWTPQNTNGVVATPVLAMGSLAPIRTFRSSGLSSTVDFDADVYGRVVMSSKGDNGVMMSYDGGASWENVSPMRRARSQANLFVQSVREAGPVYALAHASAPFDFGASGRSGELWARSIDPAAPGPARWWFLAGGRGETYGSAGRAADQTLGLPDDIYTNILADPGDPRRIYVTTRSSGIYRTDDLPRLWCVRSGGARCGAAPPRFARVSSINSNEYEGSAVIDPNRPATMYVADGQELKKLDLKTGRATVLRRSARLQSIDVWSHGGVTWIAATQDADEVYVSRTGGDSWVRSFSRADLTAARTPTFDFSISQDKLELFGLEGDGTKMYAVVQVQNPENLGYGVFEISFDPATGVKAAVRDITENLYFPKSLRTEVVTDPVSAQKYLLISTWGAGLWRRPL